MQRIVVGVDGSESATGALRWALAEGELHGAEVVAVLAWSYLDQRHAGRKASDSSFDPEYDEDDARTALRSAVAASGSSHPVEERVVCDLPATALLEASAGADLIVVGARGLGGFKGLLLGSVSEKVLENSKVPVAIVRGEPGGGNGGVVVGVDGSDLSQLALAWAATEARARQAPLHLVHAWQASLLAAPVTEQVLAVLEEGAQEIVDTAAGDPVVEGLEVHRYIPYSGAAQAILGVAENASLIVAGTRGHGRLYRAVLGSTSRQLAHHATCPIVIIPASAD
ncbi:MAG: universal stress protein [Acidimicrobiia bacterium]